MADIISGAKNILLKSKTGASTYQDYYVKSSIYAVDGLLGADNKLKTTLLPSWVAGGMKFVEVLTNNTTLDTLYSKIVTWLEERNLPTSYPYTEFQGKYFIVAPMNPTINITIPEGQTNLGILYGDDSYGGNQGESGGPGTPLVLERGDWIMYSHYSDGVHMFAVINNTYKDARENEAGVIQLATEDDALAGIDDKKAITPMKLAAVLSPIKSNITSLQGDITSLENNKQSRHISLVNLTQLMNTESPTGFIRKTGQNTYEIDEKFYTTIPEVADMIDGAISHFDTYVLTDKLWYKAPKDSPVFSGTVTVSSFGAGFVKSSSKGVLSVDNNVVTGIKGSSETDYRTGQVNITKSNIGLGSVNNYGIASQDDAQKDASTTSNKYMTPQRTKNAIDYWATIPVYASEGAIPTDLPVGKLVFVEV